MRRRGWFPANNGAGARRWFVLKDPEDPLPVDADLSERYALRKDGALRRFGSHEAAQRVADELNEKGRPTMASKAPPCRHAVIVNETRTVTVVYGERVKVTVDCEDGARRALIATDIAKRVRRGDYDA